MRQFWTKIVLILTLKCEQASLLHSDSMDRRLQWYERLALRGHFFVCRVCRKMKGQLRFLRSANEYSTKDTPDLDSCSLSSEATERIEKRLRDEMSKKAS